MRRKRAITFFVAVLTASAAASTAVAPAQAKDNILQRAARGDVQAPVIHTGLVNRRAPFFSAGLLNAVGQPNATAGRSAAVGGGAGRDAGPDQSGSGDGARNLVGASTGTVGCTGRNAGGINVRVNTDCSYRLQSEELIKWNPLNPNNLVAGMNDMLQGYNYSSFAFSFDGGRTWGNYPPPFYHKLNNPAAEEPTADDPNRHTIAGGPGNFFTYDGGSDPALAFDLQGRAFYSAIIFDRAADFGSAVVVSQSPPGAGGSFYADIPQLSRRYVVAEDNSPAAQHDKQFVTADVSPTSPNKNNVYVTWTVFRSSDQCFPLNQLSTCESPIWGSMSTDHAQTWSTPELISGTSDALCFGSNIFITGTFTGNACNLDQGSDPITLPNGDLEVIFNNGNTGRGVPNAQQLGVHCHPTGSSPAGTAHLNCAEPTKVGNDVTVGEPVCNFGRGPEECIPGAFVRTDDFPRIAINRGNGHLFATWQDYRNGEFDIQLSESVDGGLTWTEAAAPVNSSRRMDHYEPAIDVVCSGPLADHNPNCRSGDQKGAGNGGGGTRQLSCGTGDEGAQAQRRAEDVGSQTDHVAVSYYRTCRVPNEVEPAACAVGGNPPACTVFTPGQPGVQRANSDYGLAGGRDRNTPYTFKSVSPVFPPPDGTQEFGFNGDYSGLVVIGQTAHPIWSDTRNAIPGQFVPDQNPGGTHDEDVFTDAISIPDGRSQGD